MIYSWRCESCSKVTDCTRKLADIDIPPETCEHCQAPQFIERVIVRPDNCKGYILLGSGWHNDLYTKYRSIKE
jgi:predicted nucleic acid-binding Zn ribbon protein